MDLMNRVYKESSGGGSEHSMAAILAANGNIMLEGEVKTAMALSFAEKMRYLASEGKDVSILLNSPGGEVDAGLLVYDVIQKYPYDVKIICVGLAASMGAIILAGGRKGRRFILPNSKVMIHEPLIAGGFGGSATKIEQKAQLILDVKRHLNGILAKHTGKTIKEIDEATSFDNYMTAQEAVEFGICDAIGTIY